MAAGVAGGVRRGVRGLETSQPAIKYATAGLYRRILGALDRSDDVYILSCVLRMYLFDSFTDACAGHGLVTEKLPGVLLRQRRFADRSEGAAPAEAVRRRGTTPRAAEGEGWYLGRPAREPRVAVIRSRAGRVSGSAASGVPPIMPSILRPPFRQERQTRATATPPW